MNKPKQNVSENEITSIVEALDNMLDDEDPDFHGELKQCAWNILHENPGYGFDEWVQSLMEQYPLEVVDAIGSHPAETYALLADMWDTEDYEDADTGERHAFKDWAEIFATDRSIELYDLLTEARRDIKRIEAQQSQKQPNPHPRPQSPAEGHFSLRYVERIKIKSRKRYEKNI